jgi:spermidine synthase
MRLRHYAALLLVACSAAPAAARIVHSETSLYQNILVAQVDTVRCMQFTVRKDQRNQSCVDTRSPRRLVFAYTQMMMAALLVNPSPTRILMVGLGGGSLPTALAELFPDAAIDVVELDPAVFEVAKKYFAFKRAAANPERYDLILLDAYNGDYIPEHLMTREYLRETAALLSDNGVLAANTFAISRLYHNESVTYADVFGTFFNLKSPDSANRIIIARRQPLPDRATLDAAAQQLQAALKPYGVPIDRYPAQLTTDADWDTHARVLTDQYSPANLLKGQARDQGAGQ